MSTSVPVEQVEAEIRARLEREREESGDPAVERERAADRARHRAERAARGSRVRRPEVGPRAVPDELMEVKVELREHGGTLVDIVAVPRAGARDRVRVHERQRPRVGAGWILGGELRFGPNYRHQQQRHHAQSCNPRRSHGHGGSLVGVDVISGQHGRLTSMLGQSVR